LKTNKVPMRRCAGCMTSKPKKDLIRIAAYEGRVSIDRTGKAKGRGIYLCPDKECMEKARKKKSLSRGLKTDISNEQMEQLFEELAEYEKENR